MLNILIKLFDGVKEFQFMMNMNQAKNVADNFVIFGFTNKENEKITFLKEINFSIKESLNTIPVFSLLNSIEDSSISYLKSNIYKNLMAFAKSNYDFTLVWKNFIGKTALNQTVLLLNDLCFYHDFSMIISSSQSSDDNQINLISFLETIKRNFNSFLQFVKETKIKENNSKQFNFHFYAQFILQILNFMETLKYFISKKVEKTTSFEFFALPKMSFEINRVNLEQISKKNENIFFSQSKEETKRLLKNNVYSKLPNISGSSDFFNFIAANHNKENVVIEIALICFHYKLNYGYEIAHYQNKFVSFLISKKMILNIVSAFAMMDSVMVKGPSATGKHETLKVF